MKTTNKLNHVYNEMKQRCYNTKNKRYEYYGARGIRVCDEWINKEHVPGTHNCTKGWISFRKWALDNGYKEGMTIDRIDVNKNYSPKNCRWVSQKVQNNNTRSNIMITLGDRTQTLAQWCEELGCNYRLVYDRIQRYHWTAEKALSQKKPFQHEMVLEYLKSHAKGMTSKDAFEKLGIIQMPKRIWILKRLGYKIKTKTEKGVNRFGAPVHYTRYTLVEE